MTTSEQKKSKGIYCCAYHCKNKPDPKKGGLCHKHYARKLKKRDPVYDRYFNFKNNAIARGKAFSITLDQFREFCDKTGYIVKKGMRGKRCTIDRIDNRFGYYIWNIQIITNFQNIRKYYDFDRHQKPVGVKYEGYEKFINPF